jgi:hypothetical protein
MWGPETDRFSRLSSVNDQVSNSSRNRQYFLCLYVQNRFGFQPAFIQWVLGALSLWLKRSEHIVIHSPSSSVGVKNTWNFTHNLPYFFMTWFISPEMFTASFHVPHYSFSTFILSYDAVQPMHLRNCFMNYVNDAYTATLKPLSVSSQNALT